MRVVESAKFASMPNRTPAHTFSVNSLSAMWDMFHLIRLLSKVKGLCIRRTGHIALQPARKPRRDHVTRM
ncbi:hypothetical protein E2651_23620 [Streptomyces sp. MZ04]|nr:hypothetical protein E2651_23620 [Streptomyces sp. MZ04]